MKLALVAPAGTVTEVGVVTALLSLAKLTVNPPVAAAAFNVAVQISVPAHVIDEFTQVRAFREIGALVSIAVPFRPITIVPPLEALLTIVN